MKIFGRPRTSVSLRCATLQNNRFSADHSIAGLHGQSWSTRKFGNHRAAKQDAAHALALLEMLAYMHPSLQATGKVAGYQTQPDPAIIGIECNDFLNRRGLTLEKDRVPEIVGTGAAQHADALLFDIHHDAGHRRAYHMHVP